jgi:hypothetical protein
MSQLTENSTWYRRTDDTPTDTWVFAWTPVEDGRPGAGWCVRLVLKSVAEKNGWERVKA